MVKYWIFSIITPASVAHDPSEMLISSLINVFIIIMLKTAVHLNILKMKNNVMTFFCLFAVVWHMLISLVKSHFTKDTTNGFDSFDTDFYFLLFFQMK